MRPERPATSGGGTCKAGTRVEEPGAARLAGDAGGPSRKRRPPALVREATSNAAARQRGDRRHGMGDAQPARQPIVTVRPRPAKGLGGEGGPEP